MERGGNDQEFHSIEITNHPPPLIMSLVETKRRVDDDDNIRGPQLEEEI